MSANRAVAADTASSSIIERILAEERQAEERLEACLCQANVLRDRARERARHIEARADRRVERVHQAGDRLVAGGVRQVEERMRRLQHETGAELPAPGDWEAALDRVARDLIGLRDTPGGESDEPG